MPLPRAVVVATAAVDGDALRKRATGMCLANVYARTRLTLSFNLAWFSGGDEENDDETGLTARST